MSGQPRAHDSENQPPPLADYNLFTTNRPLREAVAREGAAWAAEELTRLGARFGSSEVLEWGFLANRHPPILHTHDRFGRRLDVVEYHPAWHSLLELSLENGFHSSSWAAPKPGANVARAAGLSLLIEVEPGIMCPTSVTWASVPALRGNARIAEEWLPRIFSRRYDRRFCPASEKTGALISMGMTEKQGGSDLRTNTTRALPVGPTHGPGAEYRLNGHKWFFSVPMHDAFLVTAQAPGGISCFLVPRFLPDGTVNGLHLQRLKDKLGNRANASSEVDFHDAMGVLLSEEGRGIATVIEMAHHSRHECALASAAVMRQALAQALHHAAHRRAFGRVLLDQPMMTDVLADLALESEAATGLAFRLARSFDQHGDPEETAFRRLVTPAIKYWVCKRCPGFTAEALEVLGGNGYVEESVMPRLYREAPLNSVWEGSGNVMCLDVARALEREPATADAFRRELESSRGGDARLDRFASALLDDLVGREPKDRRLVERMALALAGGLLVRHAPHAVADAFCASRLAGAWSGAYGTLPRGADLPAIVERARGQS
jgi:putative acyl-CoA dehydrogenase